MKIKNKNTVVEAIQWTGDNLDELIAFSKGELSLDSSMTEPTLRTPPSTATTYYSGDVGSWVILHTDGSISIFSDEYFNYNYEEDTSESEQDKHPDNFYFYGSKSEDEQDICTHNYVPISMFNRSLDWPPYKTQCNKCGKFKKDTIEQDKQPCIRPEEPMQDREGHVAHAANQLPEINAAIVIPERLHSEDGRQFKIISWDAHASVDNLVRISLDVNVVLPL